MVPLLSAQKMSESGTSGRKVALSVFGHLGCSFAVERARARARTKRPHLRILLIAVGNGLAVGNGPAYRQ
jgi:hypothetical protein